MLAREAGLLARGFVTDRNGDRERWDPSLVTVAAHDQAACPTPSTPGGSSPGDQTVESPVGRPWPWTIVAAVEVAVAAAAVVADAFIPTLVILALATASLLVRRRGPASLGFHRVPRPVRMAVEVLGLVVAWTVIQLALFIPVLEHLTGSRQDMSAFTAVEGNLGTLAALLALSWTLAAVGEEAAYRGFVLTRAREVLGSGRLGTMAAIGVAAALFGLAHTEQGIIGIGLTFLDALFFSVLRFRYATLWAPVLAHGFNNTIGLTAFYFVGPIYGLW